ncbi:MAG TPA: hypothetical protein DCW90_19760 [Lachnospiraceae bacterium]|nr:hypothetical protein [Lachnospiraceae bacterium]
MGKILIVIDMQNDFITGNLGTKEAQRIVPMVVKKIENWNQGKIICTMDTHDENYLSTQEGEHLPVVHCVGDSYGWQLCDGIKDVDKRMLEIKKSTFGATEILDVLQLMENIFNQDTFRYESHEFHLCGVCTDICVISNALLLKTFFPETRIVVDASCCAGTTPENHEAALKVMKSCQIEIENWGD